MTALPLFISHASDDQVIALEVCAQLEARGICCWIAPRDVAPGAQWDEAIVDAITSAGAFLLVLTSAANGSSYVKNEVNHAFAAKRPIFTFRVEDVQPSKSLGFYLARHHWTDGFPAPMDGKLGQLAAAVTALLGQAGDVAAGGVPAGGATAEGILPAKKRSRWSRDVHLGSSRWAGAQVAWLVAAVTAGALVGAVVAGTAVWLATRAAPAAPPPVRRFAITLPTTAPLAVDVNARGIAISQDGARLVYVAINTIGGTAAAVLVLRQLDRLDVMPLPGVADAYIGQPFVSPDGRSIGFVGPKNELKRVSITGGSPVTLCRLTNTPRGMSWGADDTIVVGTTDRNTGLLQCSSGGGEPKVLTTPDVKQGEQDHYWPQFLPGGQAVLFTIVPNGPIESAQIGVLNLKTGERKLLVRGGSDAQYVPTGHLVYAASGTLRAVGFDVDRLEVLGDPVPVLEQVATTGFGAANVAISREGTLVYVPGAAPGGVQRTLVWVDRQGHEEPLGAEPRPYAVPRISPDGTRVVAQIDDPTNTDIVVYDQRRKTAVRLTFDKTSDIRPMWTPDGRWVLFRSELEGPGVYRKASDGTGAIEKVTPMVGDGSPGSISPDGKTLLFSSIDPSTGRDLWAVNLEGEPTPRPLIVDPGPQGNPVISPDGRWLAYQDESAGLVFVRPFPNVAAGRWQVSPPGSKWPLWSRDGRELFYLSGSSMMAVAVDATQQTFQWTSARVLFQGSYSGFPGLSGPRNYDLSPDGRRFLMIKDTTPEQSAGTLVVVENWFEELKRLVPVK